MLEGKRDVDNMQSVQAEIKIIPIKSIRPNPYQPRKKFNRRALEELSQSIKTYGLIQPISVRKLCDESYELIAGERRLRASEIADLEEIPAIIVNYKDQDSAMVALIENLQREDLTFVEEAEGYFNLINDHGFTQQELAEKLGKSQSTIANKLRILKLPEDIKELLVENNLSERHARALLRLPDDDLKREVTAKIVKQDLTVNKTEKLIEDILDDLTKDDEEKHSQNIRGLINIKIYLNTLKTAYKAIKDNCETAKYSEKDMGDYVQVTVQIPKK